VAAFLVTGNPGSGKTALVHELVRRGVAATDADELAGWASPSGAPVDAPAVLSAAWLARHRWVWTRARLEQHLLRQSADVVFLCGIAMDQREVLDLFRRVFLLSIDEATQVARLDAAGNRDAAARQQVLTGRPFLEAEMRAAGAHVVDGSLPTTEVADLVLQQAAATLRSP
jgi:uridine kinase